MKIYTNVARKKYKSKSNFFPEFGSRYEKLTFKGIYLKQKSVSFLNKKVVNLYISCTLDKWSKDLDASFALRNCLFGAVRI